jgi:hypothetical protein
MKSIPTPLNKQLDFQLIKKNKCSAPGRSTQITAVIGLKLCLRALILFWIMANRRERS